MEDKQPKNSRTLDMYVRLCEGRAINKAEEAVNFGVDERSIQRDIDDIRNFLNDRGVGKDGSAVEIKYDRAKKGFVMVGGKESAMTNGEILAVTKILLESRAFTKEELSSILDKMVEGCVPLKNMKLVSDLIANEKYHYMEPHHHKAITHDKLWELGEDIKERNLLELKYQKGFFSTETVKRVVEPVAIQFSEYYFYLHAYIVEKNEAGKFVHKYDFPAIFRLDRIDNVKQMNEHFRSPYSSHFEEGEFRKRAQFMYPGKLMRIRLKFYGSNPEAILDRLPTARIISQNDQETEIEAESYGKGILMWILSQGERIEVLRPESLRQEMKEKLLKMLERYEGTETK